MASKQTVFRLQSRQSIVDLTTSTEEIPKAAAYEVLVKVRSVALNFRDLAIATSRYPFPVKDNVIPISDAAGEIVEIGPNVQGFTIGGPVDGVLRNYLPINADSVIKVPKESSLKASQWAALVCTGTTAWNALYGNVPLKPGQTVLFQGTGGVSITGLVLAKAAGAKTIITSSSDEKLAYVKEKYGVDHTINYKVHPEWAQEVQNITQGNGVDYIFENGGSGTIKQSIDCIAYGGVISIIGFLSTAKQEEMPDVAALALSKGCIVRGITVGSKQLLEECVRFVGSHNLDIPVEKTLPFTEEGVRAAYKYLSEGQHIGKVCIDFE
ncbi:zinc-binding dehydrogenase domain-containing protein [Trichoderma breve]|uniref:Zinc-binding dehydrogenase domain-containing protein n=1 Tax=Trichoderma breve TaxID=2034170 RepID=A0A9W9BBH8_9HYPO|nr:zinc-binding dehydrogenase domain-containing protein [Trichoderma breve]KAJ4859409.1 zinc-binding dehydrogenase domain-containing protein [Trichoderma breve]